LALGDGGGENSETVVTPNPDGKRRRKRSAHRISKRQDIAVPANPDSNTVEVSTVNQTIVSVGGWGSRLGQGLG